MRKIEKLITVALMLCMITLSAGLLYASVFASGGGQQGIGTVAVFDAPSGIRFNRLTNEFEIFSAKGLSYIASGKYVSVIGEVAEAPTSDPSDWMQAPISFGGIYNIMQDIGYDAEEFSELIVMPPNSFLNGRGFYLKSFPMQTMEGVGSCLVLANSGTIRNLNMKNADITNAEAGTRGAIVVGENRGIIENVTVYGTDSDNTYSSSLYTKLYGIAAMNFGSIINSTNNANIVNTMSEGDAAGITEAGENSSLISNTNNGNISAINAAINAAGIAMVGGNLTLVARGNINNGDIKATAIACGILGSNIKLTNIDVEKVDNRNHGKISSSIKLEYELYYEYPIPIEPEESNIPEATDAYGIKWNEEEEFFEITNGAGISYIGSDYYVTLNGNVGKDTIPGEGFITYQKASGNARYKIMNDIQHDVNLANYSENYLTTLYSIAEGGIVDGKKDEENNYKLTDFPMRRHSNTIASALFLTNEGTITGIDISIVDGVLNDMLHMSEIGGIASSNYGNISHCMVSGRIDTLNTSGLGHSVGGIVGASYSGEISYCINNATIAGRLRVGGIVGRKNAGNIRNCINNGEISVSGTGVTYGCGGILGALSLDDSAEVTIQFCENKGKLSGIVLEAVVIGGVVGSIQLAASNRVSILDSSNEGHIAAETANNSSLGGVVGNVTGSLSAQDGAALKIERCMNINASVQASGTGGGSSGGILASTTAASEVITDYFTTLLISDCSNSGDVRGVNNAGGVVGWLGAFITVLNCENSGYIESNGAAGGLIGRPALSGVALPIAYVITCTNSGAGVKGLVVGGAAGRITSDIVVCNFVNTADIDGTNVAGAVVGRVEKGIYLFDVLNTGDVNSYPPEEEVELFVGAFTLEEPPVTVQNCWSITKDSPDPRNLPDPYVVPNFLP